MAVVGLCFVRCSPQASLYACMMPVHRERNVRGGCDVSTFADLAALPRLCCVSISAKRLRLESSWFAPLSGKLTALDLIEVNL